MPEAIRLEWGIASPGEALLAMTVNRDVLVTPPKCLPTPTRHRWRRLPVDLRPCNKNA